MPEIVFRYSRPYDLHWDEWKKQQPNISQRELLERDAVLEVVNEVEDNWRITEVDVFNEISKILELDWQEEIIPCYIVSNARALSDPLTIGINERKPERLIETLLHELTHRIFIQEGNREKTRKSWEQIENKYPDQNKITHIHIICFSLLKNLYLKFLDQERLMEEIKRCEKNDEYRKAWEAVARKDHAEIIREFKEHYR
ncbi:MAG: hypothetical protein U9O20_00885 [Patescibacteria group bacterium]|nr:hypothetical protein [Patescibacteria group bacterium]